MLIVGIEDGTSPKCCHTCTKIA